MILLIMYIIFTAEHTCNYSTPKTVFKVSLIEQSHSTVDANHKQNIPNVQPNQTHEKPIQC